MAGGTGSIEDGERIAAAAWRELAEETGFAGAAIEALYDLDLVNQFHWPRVDAVISAAVFGARVGATPTRSCRTSTTTLRWVSPAEALDLVVWPAYRTAIESSPGTWRIRSASPGSGSGRTVAGW